MYRRVFFVHSTLLFEMLSAQHIFVYYYALSLAIFIIAPTLLVLLFSFLLLSSIYLFVFCFFQEVS